MYTVYLTDYNSTPTGDTPTPVRDELYIYNPITYDNGVILLEPTLSLEASKAGSFSAEMPETNYGYGRIIKGLTRVVVKKNEKIIFMGRINSEDRDMYLTESFKAEGALAYLNDSLSGKTSLVNKTLSELLDYIFDNHNDKFPNEPWKQFNLVQCDVNFVGYNADGEDEDTMAQYNIDYDKSIDLVLELVDLAKGALKIEYNEENGYWDVYIYDKFNFPVLSNQPIEFGTNLLDFFQSYDRNDICTAVAPFGGDLIQTSKEIGEAVAGEHIDESGTTNVGAHWYPDYIYVRGTDDKNYHLVDIHGTSWADSGYWSFKLDIAAYNTAHPNNPLKKIFVSWRGYKYDYDDNGTTKVCDCAWRVYDSVNVILGFEEFKETQGLFDAAINTEINLEDPQYLDASYIYVTGWGNLIKPLIRRDAEIVEQNDKLNISPCDAFEENGLKHEAGSEYLLSTSLISLYGLIEKRIEYNIEDSNIPVSDWNSNYSGVLGTSVKHLDAVLAYDAGPVGEDPDLESFKGNYQIKHFPNTGSGYSVIQYDIPGEGESGKKRPRGLFLYSRLDYYYGWGTHDEDGRHWKADGLFAVYDTSWQVLYYETCASTGTDYKNLKDFFLDLSDPKYYGAAHVRLCGFGGVIPVNIIPSDDTYSANQLMEKAKLYLTDYQWEKVVIEATAVDLSITSEQWDSLDICMNVPVISEFHGMESTMPLSALDIKLDNFEDNSLKLGYDSDEYMSAQLS